ncbi:MAG: PKD domain-containing protein [Bacteroidia bacterium]
MIGRTWLILFFCCISFLSEAIAQGGNTCASAGSAPLSLPFNLNNQSTCGDGNDYTGANGCLASGWGNPYGGQDWYFSFTANESGFLNLQFDDFQTSGNSFAYPTLSLYQGCPGAPGACLTTVQGSSFGNNGVNLIYPVQSGTQYYIGVDAFTASSFYANCYQFDLQGSIAGVPVQPSCSNMDFSNNNFNGWLGTTGIATTGTTGATTPTYNITNIGIVNGRHTIMTGGNDPCGGFPRVDPQGGPFSVRLGNNQTGAEAEQLRQTFLVSPNNSSFTYRYAVVFQDPGHGSNEQPFFRALLKDQTGAIIPCSDFVVSAAANLPGFFSCNGGVRYKPWSSVNVDLSNYLGQPVTVEFTAGDCSQGGHYGYAYIDAQCSPSTLSALADTICPGESVTLTAPTGYSSYNWQPGNINTQTITVSPTVSTTYTLSLTAFNGCPATFQVPITVAEIPDAGFTYQAPACDLPVQITGDNTTSGSTYLWNLAPLGSPASSALGILTANFPGPGTYPVTLTETNASGCVGTVTQNIIVPPCVFRVAITGDTICLGTCINFVPSMAYGVPPFSYLWSTGSTDDSINVCSSQDEIISITVTDADGFIATDTAMITFSQAAFFNSSVQNLSCFGILDGSIDAGVIGWGPFSISWQNGSTTEFIDNLASGTYALEVTDRFGCNADTSFLVTEPPLLSSELLISATTCNLDNGSIEITNVQGGTPIYSYNMDGSGPFINPLFNSLSPGNHSVTISDINGCYDSHQVFVDSLSPPESLTYSLANASCDSANGSIELMQINGGFAPYSVSLNGAVSQSVTLPIFYENLIEDLYQISLIDSNGCTLDTLAEILQEGSPSNPLITTVPGTCGLSNSEITISSVTGGIPEYTYSINGGTFSSLQTFSGLTPGTFTVSVQDVNLCPFDTIVFVPAIEPIEVLALADQHPSCHGFSNGEIHAEVNAGPGPYTFSWSQGSSDSLVSNLPAGTYIITATDANSCISIDTVSLVDPGILAFFISGTDPLCGISNGTISIDSASGGTLPYSFRLNNSNWTSATSYTNLSDGNHSMYIRDAQQCIDSTSRILITPSFPTQMTTQIVDAVCAENNAVISINGVTGGTSPLYVAIGDSIFSLLNSYPANFENLAEGDYLITIKDANDCLIDSINYVIRYPGPSSISTDIIDATCSLDNSIIAVTNVSSGTTPILYSINGGTYTADTVFSDLAAGNYQLSVIDSNGCTLDTLVQTVAVPDVEINTIISHPITCFGYNNGEITDQIPSGSPPFLVTWSNGDSGFISDSLFIGTYTATVIDSNGCTESSSTSLPQPAQIDVHINAPVYVCEGNEVMLQASVEGGSGHLDITWPAFSHSGETLIDTPDSTTNYVALATDILGCQDRDSTVILMRLSPDGTIVPDVAEGCSPICVNFSFNPISAAAIANYSWTFEDSYTAGESVPKHCFSESGFQDIEVQLEDVYGCKATLTAEGIVNVHPLPVAKFSYTPDEVDVMEPLFRFINESELADTYYWTFGDGNFSLIESPEHEFSDTGSYNVCLKISTSFGCEDYTCEYLDVNPYPTIYAPNAFTPNGDGTNDIFNIKLTYVKQFQLEIFDRWGELIFLSTDPDFGWNGTYKGNPAQEDVYAWRLTYTNILKKSEQLLGRVTLIE